jgi:outer membrane protein insertion porin family
VEGNFSPHEAFSIGGTNSVRGYEEGAIGTGRSYAVGSGEVSCRLVGLASFPVLLSSLFLSKEHKIKYRKSHMLFSHKCIIGNINIHIRN